MANLFSDDFNRANEELGASSDWTERGPSGDVDYDIVSNQVSTVVAKAASDAICAHISTTPITTADYSVQVEADGSGGGQFYGPVGRRANNGANDSDGYFALRHNTTTDDYRLYKRVSGSWTQLGSSYTAAIPGNETLKLEMNGSTIKAFLDGTERHSQTDTSLSASGDCGISDATGGTDHSGVVWDNFTADDLATNVNVLATTDALIITENAATVNAETSISANADTLAITEYAATVNAETSIAANNDALVITEFSATIGTTSDTNINATTDALTITEYSATVNAETSISATAEALVTAGYQGDVNLNVSVSANIGSLSLVEYSATIDLDSGISASYDALTLTTYAATVVGGSVPVIKQIRDAVVTELTGLTTTGANVYASRVWPMGEDKLPGLIVYTIKEESEPATFSGGRDSYYKSLEVGIEAHVKGASSDDTVDTICAQVEAALGDDHTLGNIAKDIYYTGIEIDLQGEGDKPVAVATLTYSAEYLE